MMPLIFFFITRGNQGFCLFSTSCLKLLLKLVFRHSSQHCSFLEYRFWIDNLSQICQMSFSLLQFNVQQIYTLTIAMDCSDPTWKFGVLNLEQVIRLIFKILSNFHKKFLICWEKILFLINVLFQFLSQPMKEIKNVFFINHFGIF